MEINKLIAEKETALAILKRETATIERQLEVLRAADAASQPTEFELMLNDKRPTATMGSNVFEQHVNPFLTPVKITPIGLDTGHVDLLPVKQKTERQRNPKGRLEKVGRSMLTNENHTLDGLLSAINSVMDKPVSRAAVRTLMMNLRKDGYAVSDRPGVFRQAVKGEAATNSRSVTASSATES